MVAESVAPVVAPVRTRSESKTRFNSTRDVCVMGKRVAGSAAESMAVSLDDTEIMHPYVLRTPTAYNKPLVMRGLNARAACSL